MATSASGPCLNCGSAELTRTYCPECGQKRPHRLSVGHVLHEILHSFTHADSTIGRYAVLVLLQPGRVVADYLAGRRKRYFNPFQFLLLVVGFAAAAAALLHYYDLTGEQMQQRYTGRMAALHVARVGEYFRYVGKYYNIWWLLLWALQIKAQAVNNIASSLQVLIILLYLVLVGRQALELRWPGAIWRAMLVVVLGMMAGLALNYAAFYLYVFR